MVEVDHAAGEQAMLDTDIGLDREPGEVECIGRNSRAAQQDV